MGAEDVDDAARSGPHYRHHRGLKTDILNISAVLEGKHAEDVDSAPRSGQNFRGHGGSETLDDSSSPAISAGQASVSTKPVSAATSNAKPMEARTVRSDKDDAAEACGMGLDVTEALPLRRSERLRKLRPASSGTSDHVHMAPTSEPDLQHVGPQLTLLGGGKDDQDDYYILEDDEKEVEMTLPGLLQDRLTTLQARALEPCQSNVEMTVSMEWLKQECGD